MRTADLTRLAALTSGAARPAFGPRPRIDRLTVLWSLLFPALWLAYTLVRGAIWGWYPYPFVDAAAHGYLRVVANGVLLTLVLGAVAALFALGDRRLPAVPGHRIAL